MKHYYVYILTNKRKNVLYIGLTSNLLGRVVQHREKHDLNSFTARYRVTYLVYHEEFDRPYEAILREKQVKRWRRDKKERLVRLINPQWQDLSEGWY